MTQTRVGALDALERAVRAALEGADKPFYRDPEEDVPASADGVVIMRDGEPGEPEFMLSPAQYAFEHLVEFEITANGRDRRRTVESIVALFEPALMADRSLGGTVDDARIMSAPAMTDFKVDGAAAERTAVLYVQLSYTTLNAAG